MAKKNFFIGLLIGAVIVIVIVLTLLLIQHTKYYQGWKKNPRQT